MTQTIPCTESGSERTEAEAVALLAQQLFVTTADDSATRDGALAELLHTVRGLLGMDIAFVSEFVGDSRVFHHVSLAPDSPSKLASGDADERALTYCQRVVDGRLPGVIPDSADFPAASELPVTRSLGIGAFLSAPVVLGDGQVYGTVCCISHSPRTALGSRQIDALRCVAAFVAREIERNSHP